MGITQPQSATTAARAFTMTPCLAKAILNASPQIARPVNRREVVFLAHRMRHPDPEDTFMSYPVEIDRDGHLVTGRRVLLAVILAETGVPVDLVEDCEPNRFTHYPPFGDPRPATDPVRDLHARLTDLEARTGEWPGADVVDILGEWFAANGISVGEDTAP